MKNAFVFFLLLSAALRSLAQSTNCTDAVAQLQNYATQVNQIYAAEYLTVIPNQRCPAYDAWGRPYNPVLVQNCRLTWLSQLNGWYAQQSMFVNNAYMQITRGCTTKDVSEVRKPARTVKPGSDQADDIDTDHIEELTADVDESKAVKITIPKTAAGFRRSSN